MVRQGHISLTVRPRMFGSADLGGPSGRDPFPVTSFHLHMFFVPNKFPKMGRPGLPLSS